MFDLSRIELHLDRHSNIQQPVTWNADKYPHTFAVQVGSVSKYGYLGIRKDAYLIFNLDSPFEEGSLSCFMDLTDRDIPQLSLSTANAFECFL